MAAGRAAFGSFRSPLWAGGGVCLDRSPAATRRRSMTAPGNFVAHRALSERLKAGDVVIVDDISRLPSEWSAD